MNQRAIAFVLLLACHGANRGNGSSFERGMRAAGNGDYKKAAALLADAASAEPDRERRNDAIVRLANIEWRGFRDHGAARARLRALDTVDAHVELARIAADLGDFPAARAEAKKAIAVASKKGDRIKAAKALAIATTTDPHASRDDLQQVVTSMRALLAGIGPLLAPARLLARAALRLGDGAAALEGVDAYDHVSKFNGPPRAIAASHAVLARLLPSWRGTDAERPELAAALAGIRFFDEAVEVSPGGDIGAYDAMLHRIETLTNEYYRRVALGDEDERVLRDGVKRELDDHRDLFAKRFGVYTLIGKTGSHVDLHMGHVVADTNLAIEQYGHRATKRFVLLDSMVSNGFSEWANDGASGDGGWGTATDIYQVRPRYADGPLRDWTRVTDAEERASGDRKIAEETARDRQHARENPIQFFPGLALRLQRQYLDGVIAELRARGLAGDALRDAFLARVESDDFESSIVRHEGRHAIDIASGVKYPTWELEYRAKLSEIALAPSPRQALGSVFDNDIGGEGTHAKANGKLATELAAWMEAHRAEIAGYDVSLPPLPQIDRLTDAQIRASVRGLDPLS